MAFTFFSSYFGSFRACMDNWLHCKIWWVHIWDFVSLNSSFSCNLICFDSNIILLLDTMSNLLYHLLHHNAFTLYETSETYLWTMLPPPSLSPEFCWFLMEGEKERERYVHYMYILWMYNWDSRNLESDYSWFMNHICTIKNLRQV